MVEPGLGGLLSANSSGYSPRLLRTFSEGIVRFNETMEGNKGGDFSGLGLCRPTYDEFSIKRDARELAEMGLETLILGGGDGSVLKYLIELGEVYGERDFPNLIYLPMGRENRLSYELGIPRKPIKVFNETLKDMKEGNAEYEEMSLIEVTLDEEQTISTFDLGFGMATNVLINYYGMDPGMIKKGDHFRNMAYPKKKIDSFTTFAGVVFNSFRYWTESAKKYFGETIVDVKIDGIDYGKQSRLGGFISTNKHVWKGFKLMYRGREDLEKMHLVITSLPPPRLVFELPTIYKGRPLGGDTIDEIAKEGSLIFEKKTIVQVAGEFYIVEKVDFKVERKTTWVKPNLKKKEKKGTTIRKWFARGE